MQSESTACHAEEGGHELQFKKISGTAAVTCVLSTLGFLFVMKCFLLKSFCQSNVWINFFLLVSELVPNKSGPIFLQCSVN